MKQIKEHTQSVSSLAVSPSGKLFATGSDDKTVKIFESATYKCLQTIACANWVYRVCFASDDVVIAGVESSELVSFSVSTGKVKATFAKHVSPKGIAILGAGMVDRDSKCAHSHFGRARRFRPAVRPPNKYNPNPCLHIVPWCTCWCTSC